MNKLTFISLIYLTRIHASNADEAITQWKYLLIDTGLYEKYKHLNPSYYRYEDHDWLNRLSKKYDKKEWIYYKVWLNIVLLGCIKEYDLPVFYLLQPKADF